jgi:hypothetical protein
MILTGRNLSILRIFRPRSIQSPINVTQNDLGSNSELCGERPATDTLSDATVITILFMMQSQE